MTANDPRNLICTHGDLLDRHMFSNSDFAGIFPTYPQVWARYIVPQREPGNPALTSQQWIRFAESHYSTIVRCWSAWQALNSIDRICTEACDIIHADLHLQLHSQLLTYFCSLGAAIDCMSQVFANKPIKCPPAFDQIKDRNANTHNLKWVYDRRTQYVHKAIVPVFQRDGLLSLDQGFYDDTETKWDNTRLLDAKSVEELVRYIWMIFQQEMQSVWSKLIELLKKSETTNLGYAIELSSPETRGLQSSSESGVPMLPWPSGVGETNADSYSEGGID